MPVDALRHMPADSAEALRRAVTERLAPLQRSQILAIASQVRRLQGEGRTICDLTIGDFSPRQFRVPEELEVRSAEAFRDGHTNYPPAEGILELRQAICRMYERELGLSYSPESVVVASGARPVMFATWQLTTAAGDRTASFVPAWNNGYYAEIFGAEHTFFHTGPESNFHPNPDQAEQALRGTRHVVLNSPLNPTGTAIARDALEALAHALVDENRHRGSGRAVILQYDQVYWQLRAPGVEHYNPVALVPECAPWVVHVDAISKCFAATGLRLGWAVLPPYLQPHYRALIGHIGAWAPRPVQVATAWLLDHPDVYRSYLRTFNEQLAARLERLHAGVLALRDRGLPVDAIRPQGAMYLGFRVELPGGPTNEQVRTFLLEEAGLAVVPFQAFDLREDSGWFRMSVGAVGLDEIDPALERLADAVRRRLG